MAHMVCLADTKAVSDCPEPIDHKKAITTPDAEERAKEIKVEFDSMKRTDLLSNSGQLPENGR